MLKRSYKKIIKNLDTIKDGVNKALGINDRENKLFIDLIYDLILAFAQNPNKTTTETFSDLLVKKENKLRKEFKKMELQKILYVVQVALKFNIQFKMQERKTNEKRNLILKEVDNEVIN